MFSLTVASTVILNIENFLPPFMQDKEWTNVAVVDNIYPTIIISSFSIA